jgi:hypothetical protein
MQSSPRVLPHRYIQDSEMPNSPQLTLCKCGGGDFWCPCNVHPNPLNKASDKPNTKDPIPNQIPRKSSRLKSKKDRSENRKALRKQLKKVEKDCKRLQETLGKWMFETKTLCPTHTDAEFHDPDGRMYSDEIPEGEFRNQVDVKWIVIRGSLRGHNDKLCGWPHPGLSIDCLEVGRP